MSIPTIVYTKDKENITVGTSIYDETGMVIGYITAVNSNGTINFTIDTINNYTITYDEELYDCYSQRGEGLIIETSNQEEVNLTTDFTIQGS